MNVFEEAEKWEKYLNYLKDFAEKHKDPIWIGLYPYNYIEWLFYHSKGEV